MGLSQKNLDGFEKAVVFRLIVRTEIIFDFHIKWLGVQLPRKIGTGVHAPPKMVRPTTYKWWEQNNETEWPKNFTVY